MTQVSEPMFAIETVGMTKRFGTCTAVDELDLRIPRGTVFGLIGPNGAGKSTTIRMLMGLSRPTCGVVRVLGEHVIDCPTTRKARIGYVPETPSVYRWMKVDEAVRFCRSFYDTWNDELCSRLKTLFELNGEKVVGSLSKGSLAKLGLLLAISPEPEVLILDEPTAGLDPLVREEFLDGVLAEICRRPQTVFLSSHTLGDVQRLADSVGILHEGRLLVSSSTDQLLASTKRLRAVLRDGASPALAPPGTIWQGSEHREWSLTVHGFSESTIEFLRRDGSVEHVEVLDLNLEEIFKDFIKGRRLSA